MRVLDLFAGAGGWSQGLPSGVEEMGLELDISACWAARKAGHIRVKADVAKENPASYGPVTGLLASPPCQGFSLAGGRAGLSDIPTLLKRIKDGTELQYVNDHRSELVLEPLRWALELSPEWIALEQVPSVLPVWEAIAGSLEAHGYSTDTGILRSEQFGVPQTRRRAFLVASRVKEARLPTPTHSKYHVRNPRKLDVGVKPWVSIQEALGVSHGALHHGEQKNSVVRAIDLPAATMVFGHSFRSFKFDNSVPLTLEQAAVLQSFPEDYPWTGNLQEKWQQVGNAVPPLLAKKVVEVLL